uniref:NADH dehydrogenase [ubiquinone] 1 beta subcomplex subunit 3 n=1 Tax=Globodera rostochiensis TaxID=31243 RepID=A0A914HWP3_GLORO
MGHGNGDPFKVPHWSVYNDWQRSPHLVAYAKRLERMGLKDPWIRNIYWMYNPEFPNKAYTKEYTPGKLAWKILKPGFKQGLALAVVVLVAEEAYSKLKYGHTSWGGHWAEPAHNGH